MGGVVAAVVHVVGDLVVDIANQAAVVSEAGDGGQEALGHAEGHVHALGLAPLGDEVAVAQHDAGDGAAGLGRAEGRAVVVLLAGVVLADLLGEVAQVALAGGFGGVVDRPLEQIGVHAHLLGRPALPVVAGAGEVCGRQCRVGWFAWSLLPPVLPGSCRGGNGRV